MKTQEELIESAAIKCIEKSSVLDFTMAALAKEAGVSPGTVYKYFHSKENILASLALRDLSYASQVISRTLSLPLTTPELLIGTLLLPFEDLCLFQFSNQLQNLMASTTFINTRPNLLKEYTHQNKIIETMFHDTIYQAYESGELNVVVNERDIVAEELIIGLSSMRSGFFQRLVRNKALATVSGLYNLANINNANKALICSARRLINTYPWSTPLDEQGVEKASKSVNEKRFVK